MEQRRLTRHAVRRQRRQLGRNRSADVGPEQDPDRGIEIHDSARTERDHDTDAGRTALNDHGGNQPDPDRAEQRPRRDDPVGTRSAVEPLERGNERGMIRQLFQLAAHDLHAEEQQSQPEERFPQLNDFFIFEKRHPQPQDDGRHDDDADFERHELGRDGRSDICAKNDSDGLLKCQ